MKEKRAIKGAEAIAERPDGTRIPIVPFPTPLRDESGALIGAINTVVEITGRKDAERVSQLLEAIVEGSHDEGEVRVDFDPSGLICTMKIPLAAAGGREVNDAR